MESDAGPRRAVLRALTMRDALRPRPAAGEVMESRLLETAKTDRTIDGRRPPSTTGSKALARRARLFEAASRVFFRRSRRGDRGSCPVPAGRKSADGETCSPSAFDAL